MSDYYSIQEVGGAELAGHYPDRGIISDSDWHKAVLKVTTRAKGWWGWLTHLDNQPFSAVLSANSEGLRIFVALDNFITFLPWSELSVSRERMLPATMIRLSPAAVPTLTLVCHLDDEGADDLLRHTGVQLRPRIPPRRLGWESDNPWLIALFYFSVVIVVLLAWSFLQAM